MKTHLPARLASARFFFFPVFLRNVCTVAALVLWASVQAQTAIVIAAEGSPPNAPALGVRGPQRIIDECSINGAPTLCSIVGEPGQEPVWKTVTLEIPDFTAADMENKVYVMSHVGTHSSGGGSVFPDADGYLSKQEIDPASLPPGTDRDEAQYYFTAIDIDTLEARVTLDLYQVGLFPLLNSLQSAVLMGERMALRSNVPPGRRGPRVGGNADFMEVQVSVRGEHLTIDEVLDAIYLDSGCIIDQTDAMLMVASCP